MYVLVLTNTQKLIGWLGYDKSSSSQLRVPYVL